MASMIIDSKLMCGSLLHAFAKMNVSNRDGEENYRCGDENQVLHFAFLQFIVSWFGRFEAAERLPARACGAGAAAVVFERLSLEVSKSKRAFRGAAAHH